MDLSNLQSIMQPLSSFSEFSSDLQIGLCQVMRYEKFERRRIVIRKGHSGRAMYFLCYGSVGVIHDTVGLKIITSNHHVKRVVGVECWNCWGK